MLISMRNLSQVKIDEKIQYKTSCVFGLTVAWLLPISMKHPSSNFLTEPPSWLPTCVFLHYLDYNQKSDHNHETWHTRLLLIIGPNVALLIACRGSSHDFLVNHFAYDFQALQPVSNDYLVSCISRWFFSPNGFISNQLVQITFKRENRPNDLQSRRRHCVVVSSTRRTKAPLTSKSIKKSGGSGNLPLSH